MALIQNQASRNICAALAFYHGIEPCDYEIEEIKPDRIYIRDLTGTLLRRCKADRKTWTSELPSTAAMEHKGTIASFREKTHPSLQLTFLSDGLIDTDLDFFGPEKGLIHLWTIFAHGWEVMQNAWSGKTTDEQKMKAALIKRGVPARLLQADASV